nr:apolipoprotein A-I-like [Pogona vitticeps]
MKIVILILASMLFAGSHPFVIREAPEPDSKLDVVLDGWQLYRRDVQHLTDKILFVVSRSNTSVAFLDTTFRITRYLNTLHEEIPPEIKELLDVMVGVPLSIMDKAVTAFYDLRRKQDMAEPLKSVVSYYSDPILERVGPWLESLQRTLRARIQELEHRLDKMKPQFETLDTQLSFYLQKLEDTHASLEPVANEVRTRFRQMVEALHKNLKPYMMPILEESRKYAREFKEWVRTPVFPPNP